MGKIYLRKVNCVEYFNVPNMFHQCENCYFGGNNECKNKYEKCERPNTYIQITKQEYREAKRK